jgi:hypothetical protein
VFPVRYGRPTVYLCVPYGSHSKQRLFPHPALYGWGMCWSGVVFRVWSERVSQQTATVSPHSINRLASVVET